MCFLGGFFVKLFVTLIHYINSSFKRPENRAHFAVFQKKPQNNNMESNNLLTIYSIQFNLLLSSRKLHLILNLNVNSLDRLLGEKCQLRREAFQPQKIMHALGVYGLFASLLSIKKEENN